MRRGTLIALAIAAVAGIPLAWWANRDDTASRTVAPVVEPPRGSWIPVGSEAIPGQLGKMARITFTDDEGACQVTDDAQRVHGGRLIRNDDQPGHGVLRLGDLRLAFPVYHAAHDLLIVSDQRESRSFIPAP